MHPLSELMHRTCASGLPTPVAQHTPLPLLLLQLSCDVSGVTHTQMGTNDLDAPAAYVVSGWDVATKLFKYNDPIDNPKGAPGPDQTKLQAPGGLEHLHKDFPDLDYIVSAKLI